MGVLNSDLHSRLLCLLLNHREKAVSGELLSRELGVTRAAVWKEIAALRKVGYAVEAATNRGYRLTVLPDLLRPELVRAFLRPGGESEIICLPQVDSTILHLNRLLLEGAEEGTAVLADRQTNGMGRMGRPWDAPEGEGVYLAYALTPRCAPQRLGLLTSYAGLAVCGAIQRVCGVSPAIKWPNDIILQDKKICGILTRLVSDAETGGVSHAIVGIGINVKQRSFPEELSQKAVSLWQVTGRDYARAELAGVVIGELNRIFREERWLEQPGEQALEELRARSCTLGRQVTVLDPLRQRQGEAVDIAADGALVVRFPEGEETVNAGEVSVRGILGYTV